MITEQAETYRATIWIAGDYDDARQVVKEFCASGFCATVTRTTFIYTGGEEAGVSVGCLNYPRFPSSPPELLVRAEALAIALMEGLHQHSVLVCADDTTRWMSRR